MSALEPYKIKFNLISVSYIYNISIIKYKLIYYYYYCRNFNTVFTNQVLVDPATSFGSRANRGGKIVKYKLQGSNRRLCKRQHNPKLIVVSKFVTILLIITTNSVEDMTPCRWLGAWSTCKSILVDTQSLHIRHSSLIRHCILQDHIDKLLLQSRALMMCSLTYLGPHCILLWNSHWLVL